MPRAEAPFIRFMRGYQVNEQTGCWEWQGQIWDNGYGVIKCFGRMRGAHQLSHELFLGPVPDGLEILHSCDNKRCVNPDHLSAGTHARNMQEAWERGRIVAQSRPNPRRGVKSSQSRCVIVLGKPYGSLNEAETALGLGSGSVAYWLRRKSPKATEISREEYYRLTSGDV